MNKGKEVMARNTNKKEPFSSNFNSNKHLTLLPKTSNKIAQVHPKTKPQFSKV